MKERSFFIIEKEYPDYYLVKNKVLFPALLDINSDSKEQKEEILDFEFKMVKNIFLNKKPGAISPIYNEIGKLDLRPGDVFQINNSYQGLDVCLRNEDFFVFLYDKVRHYPLMPTLLNIEKEDITNVKSIYNNAIMNQIELDSLIYMYKKREEPDEAIILVYKNESNENEIAVLWKQGIGTLFDDDLSLSLSSDDRKVGIHYCKNIRYLSKYNEYSMEYDTDVKYEEENITVEKASNLMGISIDELLKKIDHEYPYHYEGNIMDCLEQFKIMTPLTL